MDKISHKCIKIRLALSHYFLKMYLTNLLWRYINTNNLLEIGTNNFLLALIKIEDSVAVATTMLYKYGVTAVLLNHSTATNRGLYLLLTRET